jgi:hypothetical protein
LPKSRGTTNSPGSAKQGDFGATAPVEQPKPLGGWRRAWSILNSAIVIWLLSSVALGLFGWWRDLWRERQEISRQIAKLDREISSRLQHLCGVWWASDVLRVQTDSAMPSVMAIVRDRRREAIAAAQTPARSEVSVGVYPEFANRGLASLILELRDVSPDSAHPSLDLALIGTRYFALELNSAAVRGALAEGDTVEVISTWFDDEPIRMGVSGPHPFRLLNLVRWSAPLSTCTAASSTAPGEPTPPHTVLEPR